jgi:hypothetical protein
MISGSGNLEGGALAGKGKVVAAAGVGGKTLVVEPTGLSAAVAITIDAGANLELGKIADGSSIHFNGASAALQVDQPPKFSGELAAIATTDVLVFAGTSATGASLSASDTVLTVALTAGGTKTFAVAGSFRGVNFADAAGNARVAFTATASAALHASTGWRDFGAPSPWPPVARRAVQATVAVDSTVRCTRRDAPVSASENNVEG